MNTIKKYFTQVLQGPEGSFSSKRAVTMLCAILMVVGFVANMFFGFKVDQFIYESIMYIVIAGLGFTVPEKFAPKKDTPEE